MLIRHTLWLWLWLSADKIVLLLEFVARYSNANFDVGTITRDATDIAHGIITDCLLFDPMHVELLYVRGRLLLLLLVADFHLQGRILWQCQR